VKRGDTLYSIAKKHRLTVADLLDLNDLRRGTNCTPAKSSASPPARAHGGRLACNRYPDPPRALLILSDPAKTKPASSRRRVQLAAALRPDARDHRAGRSRHDRVARSAPRDRRRRDCATAPRSLKATSTRTGTIVEYHSGWNTDYAS
jgi:hypothetical protein